MFYKLLSIHKIHACPQKINAFINIVQPGSTGTGRALISSSCGSTLLPSYVRLFPWLSRFALSLLTSLLRCFFVMIPLPSLFSSFHFSSSLFISLRLWGPPLCCSPSLFVACLRSLFVARRRSSPPLGSASSLFVDF